MVKIFFTADQHFNHPLLARLRGFEETPEGVAKMNEKLIRDHNERVREEDTVFSLGDFLVHGYKPGPGQRKKAAEFLDLLHGNVVLIKGNHDENNGVPAFIDSAQIFHGGKLINMCHKPEDYMQAYPLNLVGHVHSNWKTKHLIDHCTLVNVGVDVWGFRPITIQDVNKLLAKERREPIPLKTNTVLIERGEKHGNLA